jgi:hypothetical protein
MSQDVTVHDLESYVFEKRLESIAGQFGKGYHRQIDYLVGTGEYVVLDHHQEVWKGVSAEAALEAYREIQPM